MPELNIKTYYTKLKKYERLGVQNEGTVRAAFQELLEDYCRKSKQLTLLICDAIFTHILAF